MLLRNTCHFNITAYTKRKRLATGLTEEYVFYTCTKKNKHIPCDEPQISGRLLEQAILAKISEFEISQQAADECRRWIDNLYASYIAHKNQYRPRWNKELREAQRALDVLDQKLEAGVISDSRYATRAAQHEAVIARTTQLLSNDRQDTNIWLELSHELFSSVTNIGDIFKDAMTKKNDG